MTWTLRITENQIESITDVGQLRRRLSAIHEDAMAEPAFVMLTAPDGACLAVGLGRELSALSYTAPGGWPAKHVVGDEAVKGLIDYKFFGHFSEIPAREAIPVEQAMEAAVEFFVSGRLSEGLEWEDD